MLIIGHRGAMGYAPENTLRSFRKAVELGVGMVELDVHLVDGQLVCIHDDTVDRTTNGRGRLRDLGFEDLRKFDAGDGEQIPTLSEALDCINKRCGVIVELKGAGTAEPVATLLRKYVVDAGWEAEQFMVLSARRDELKRFRELWPDMRLVVLARVVSLNYARLAREVGAYAVTRNVALMHRGFVERAHRRDLKVIAHTVNEPAMVARVKALGADGVFSDKPDVAKRAAADITNSADTRQT